MTEIIPPVRVRFAPSPTGYLHIGGARTAMFNWLFAQHYGGQFLLRIEDTDENRYVLGAAEQMMEALRWIGLSWDEGPDVGGPHAPYVQSERKSLGIYQRYADELLARGSAYKCFVTPEEDQALRAAWEAAGNHPQRYRFRGPERDWSPEQVAAAEAIGKPYTIRLKVPLEGTTSFSDIVRGGEQITIGNAELYDIVLIKTGGMPVYHMAHLIDDHLMGITHVLRSDEWVPSAPFHILLYQALGWEPPVFAHLPPIFRQDGRGKLSKRRDDVDTMSFRDRGYLADAMFNYLALQGWSYDDHTEIMTRDEIAARFSIERVQPSPARWNPEKLLDMNGIYIRALSTEETAARILPFLISAGLLSENPSDAERAYVLLLAPLIHERLKELGEAPDLLRFFFADVHPHNEGGDGYDPATLVQKKMDATATRAALEQAQGALSTIEPWSEGQLEATLRELSETIQVKPGPLFGSIRVAVTGSSVAPPLFATLALLGKERTLTRLAAAVTSLYH